ncbi:MAG: PQQ-like beta-propeller repeat protein [Taibaiella sp.]|nr:PQQ-like beta-propeller repeat protein [Taibaiella sp.]
MFKYSVKFLQVLCLLSVVFASCSKKYSSDDSLAPQYSPSVIMGSNNRILYAYAPSTGKKNWETSFPSSIFACPMVYYNRVYVAVANTLSFGGMYDTLYKLNSSTGKLVKKMTILGAAPFSLKATPIAEGKLIYLATSVDSVYAIDTGTGAVTWRAGTDGPIESSPAIYDSFIYVATTAGSVYCIDKLTGARHWVYSAGAGKSFTSSPSLSVPNLYVGCSDSAVYCIKLKSTTSTGVLNWIYKTNGPVTSSPAVTGGKCIFGCKDYYVYSVDVISGGLNQKFRTATDVTSSPVVSAAKDVVYIGGYDHILYALNVLDLTVRWKYPTSGLIKSSPLLYKGMVYIGSYDHAFYAIDALTGTLKWTTTIEGDMECSPAIEDYSHMQYNSQVSGFTN